MNGPNKYKPEYDELAYKLTLLGHTDKELALFFDVTEQTINNWKKSHPSFFESIKKGKDIADVEIVMALRKRALGYRYTETSEEKGYIRETVKEMPPEVSAQCFWLKNRQPKQWRDKQEVEHSGGMNINNSFKNMTDAELEALANQDENISD